MLLCYALSVSASANRIVYVDDSAGGANDGTSWSDAYTFLQDALADANSAEKPAEIRVAQGIYTPDSNSVSPEGTGDRKATFQLINDVTIKGGYAGPGEADPDARNVEAYKTILSGDLEGNDVEPNDLYDLVNEPSRLDNSETIVTGSKTNATACLDGFIITAGRYPFRIVDPIRGPIKVTKGGAGMNNFGGSPTVVKCTFTDNLSGWSGAAMHNSEHSSPTVIDCTFKRNHAQGSGGAMANRGNSNPTVTGCEFSDNVVMDNGGAMFNVDSNPTLTGCTFIWNGVLVPSGSVPEGGAMYNIISSLVLTNCAFIENSAASGGAMFNKDCTTELNMCSFTGNTALRNAGAILNEGGQFIARECVFKRNYPRAVLDDNSNDPTFTDCTFSGNLSRSSGGAALVVTATLSNCLFTGNVAGRQSSGGFSNSSEGGAVFAIENVVLKNCTFSDNYAGSGCAVRSRFTNVNNSIFWGPGEHIPEMYRDLGWVNVRYSVISGEWPGEGNIDVDPCFVEPGYWVDADDPNVAVEPNDPNAVWVDGDYHLKSQAGRWDPESQNWVQDDVTSPCIDAGDPNSPIGHELFPNGGRVNMGAYGSTAEASKSYFGGPVCETIIAGDINGDCKVDFTDLMILVSHWSEDAVP